MAAEAEAGAAAVVEGDSAERRVLEEITLDTVTVT